MAEGYREDVGHRRPILLRCRVSWLPVMLPMALVWLSLAATARAQAPALLEVDSSRGFARLVLVFEDRLPQYQLNSSTGVLVVSFQEPVAPDVSRLPQRLPQFVSAARTDPDRRALRLAFARHVSVNAMEAGEKLFIDLLPDSWVGAAPGLPPEVVAELARRAQEAEARRRQKEILEQYRNSKPVELRIAGLPTFTRFVFVWDTVPNARIERSATRVRLQFDRGARIDLAGYESRLPAYVYGISSSLSEEGLEIVFEVDPQAPVRGFREDSTYVVDITMPDVAAGTFGGALQPLEEIRVEPATDSGAPRTVPDRITGKHDPRKEYADTEAEGLPARSDQSGPPAVAAQLPEVAPDQAEVSPSATADAAADAEPVVPEDFDGDVVRAEARRFGTSIRLALPFSVPTNAAVFERAGALWAVFDTATMIDVQLLRENLVGIARRVESWRDGPVSVLRLDLAVPMTSSVATEETTWLITLGDSLLEPTLPMELHRASDETGNAEVRIAFAGASGPFRLRDRDTGDSILIATGPAPARNLVKPFQFVEFTALQSVHGVAISPKVDDLALEIDAEEVRVRRPSRGLALSEYSRSYAPHVATDSDDGRPGFVNVLDGALDPGAVYKILSKAQREAAAAPEIERTRARMRLARALLASDLGAEAIGQLTLVAQDDPAMQREPSFHALRGIGMVMLGRPDEAIRDFNTFGLGQSSDIALWRGLAEVERGNWQAAHEAFMAGNPALPSYARDRQRQFRIGAVRAALGVGDIATATIRLAELSAGAETGDLELNLLQARLAAALGQTEIALQTFDAVAAGDSRKLAAEAQLLKAELQRASVEQGDTEAMIRDLERLAMSWRGDEIELRALRLLANLHAERGEYYRAFELMKSATLANSESPTTRALQDEMNLVFQDLFLGPQAARLAPIDALALYYDFRELTPIGAKGDEIIRALANRMIEVDLLNQAADLLAYQVDHRLRGAARAQVAARLAWVLLMNHRPTEALNVLARTRQAVLPRTILHQRILLEARAMAETGRTELALDLLSSIEGEDVDAARADVLWKAEMWQPAAEAFERLLDDAWSTPRPLDAEQRTQVLRAAIGYALAKDQLGLDRFRTKFLAKMAESPDAHAFEVLTQPLTADATEFAELVRKVAAVDTLTAFLEAYRKRYEAAETNPDAPQS